MKPKKNYYSKCPECLKKHHPDAPCSEDGPIRTASSYRRVASQPDELGQNYDMDYNKIYDDDYEPECNRRVDMGRTING